MNHHAAKAIASVAMAAGAVVLTACGTSRISRGLTDDGQVAEAVFPDIAQDAWRKDGAFVGPGRLQQVASGATKAQIYDLLGPPHFAEGIGDVREWDYVLAFGGDRGAEDVACQYKVVFDQHHRARSFYWKPASCADRAKPASPD